MAQAGSRLLRFSKLRLASHSAGVGAQAAFGTGLSTRLFSLSYDMRQEAMSFCCFLWLHAIWSRATTRTWWGAHVPAGVRTLPGQRRADDGHISGTLRHGGISCAPCGTATCSSPAAVQRLPLCCHCFVQASDSNLEGDPPMFGGGHCEIAFWSVKA